MTQKKQTIPFLTFRAGEGLGVPEAGMAIIRYNYDLGRIELSLDGGSYQGLSGSADGYFYGEFLAAPIVPPLLDGYIAYIDYASTELNKISVDGLLALLSSASSSLQAAYESGNTITTDSGNGEFSVSGTENISLSSFADIQVSAVGTLFLGSGSVDTAWPAAVGAAGTVLTNDGAGNLSWDPPASGSPGGPDTAIQFNNSGSFDGDSALKWSGSNLLIENFPGMQGALRSDLVFFQAAGVSPSVDGNQVGLGYNSAIGGVPALYLKAGFTGDVGLLQLQGPAGSSPGLSLRYSNNEYPIEKPLRIDVDGGPIKIGNNSAYYLTTAVTLGSSSTPVNISDAFTLPMVDGANGEVLTTDGAGNVSWAAAGGSGTVTGSGTATRVAFWDGASSLSSNANLYWDDIASRLGIGTSAPGAPLTVSGGSASGAIADVYSSANSNVAIAVSNGTSGTAAQASLYIVTDSGAGRYASFAVTSDGWTTNGLSLPNQYQSVTQTGLTNGILMATQVAAAPIVFAVPAVTGSGVSPASERVRINETETVVNDPGNAHNFRVESDGNANMLFVDGTNNRVGIGTSAPVAALDVASGQLAIPDGSAAAPAIAFRDNLSSGFFSPANDIVGVGVNGTEIARFQQSGGSPVLLVGTSTVYGQFTLDSSDVTAGAVMLGHGAAGTVLQESYRGGQLAGVRSRGTKAAPTQIGAGDGMINVLGAGWTATGGINYGAMMTMKAEQAFTSTASGGRIEFHTTASGTDGFTTLGSSTTERVRITNAGSVGIGTTSPVSLLSVGSSSQFQVNSSGDIVAIRGQTTTFPAANASGALTNDGSGNLSWSPAGTVTGSGVATRVAFWSGTSSLSSDSNLYWDDSNNRLGVGIATPAHVVDVQAGSTASGVYALNVDATLTPGGGTIVSYIEGSVSASVVAPVYGVIGYLSGAGTPSTSYAGNFGTVIAGSGQDPVSALQANFALQGSAAGTTASGHNVGMMGLASNGARNYAVFGNTTGDGTGANIAVTGMAKNNGGGVRIGGLFALQTTGASQPTVSASAALIADNMDKGDPIFLARDNGTTTFSVGNDGVVLSKNTSDGTTAFSVQNAAGSTIFDVDTTNARVGVGTNAPTALMDVVGSSGIRFRTNSSSAGFDIFDRPTVPGDQLVFQGNTGNYTLFNVATKNATSASEKLSAFALWSVDIANTGNATQLQVQNNPTYGGVFFTQKFGTGTERKISLQSEWQQSSTPTQLVLDTNGNVGIGTATPTSTFSVGASSQFQVSSTGDIVAIRGQTTTFPAANASGVLTNNGSGTLSWVSASSQNGTMPISTKTANYTLTSSDGTVLADASAGAITISLPSAASSAERIFTIKKKDVTANAVIIDADASELIDGATTYTLNTQYEAIKIQSDGSAWWII